MAFFRNEAVNRLNLHTTIQSLAVGAGGLFFLAFLLRAGVSIPATLLAQAAILAGRFVIRPLVLPLGVRFGLKPVIIAGALVRAAQYPLLAEVKGLDAWLAAVCVVAAVGDALYWPSYHAQFASLGDAEHRGHQVSAREAVASLVNIVAPLIGAFALTTLGPRVAFGAVAVVQALSVAPLLGAPIVAIAPRITEPYRAVRLGLALIVSDGWFTATYWIVWQIALFVSLGRSIGAFGGAMALAQLAGAVIGLALGRHIDKGGGARGGARLWDRDHGGAGDGDGLERWLAVAGGGRQRRQRLRRRDRDADDCGRVLQSRQGLALRAALGHHDRGRLRCRLRRRRARRRGDRRHRRIAGLGSVVGAAVRGLLDGAAAPVLPDQPVRRGGRIRGLRRACGRGGIGGRPSVRSRPPAPPGGPSDGLGLYMWPRLQLLPQTSRMASRFDSSDPRAPNPFL
jgi:hypothetical protein